MGTSFTIQRTWTTHLIRLVLTLNFVYCTLLGYKKSCRATYNNICGTAEPRNRGTQKGEELLGSQPPISEMQYRYFNNNNKTFIYTLRIFLVYL